MPPVYSRRFRADRNVVVNLHESRLGEYQRLQQSNRDEERRLFEALGRAVATLKENPQAGKHIPRDRTPREYRSLADGAGVWKLNLPGGWRLLYLVDTEESNVAVELIEWLSHTEYERRFRY